ncbi:MAG TPA: hypothetical protein VME41_02025 [Stellaceae bacterium]|nr:hypothetical protein [Stellaceae bacterium]
MARPQTERIHIALTPTVLAKLSDYRHIARVDSRSHVLRQLVAISLEGKLPEDHIHILKQVLKLHKDSADLPERKTAHVHITFDENDIRKIEHYRRISPFETRSDVVRYLLAISLEKNLPEEHLLRLKRMEEEQQNSQNDETPIRPNIPASVPPPPKDVC